MTSHQSTPREFRGLGWICESLQTAIALEHSTMPLYSAAMYSLEVQNYPSYNTIRSVLMEEMLHMAAVANVLAALGGSPRIRGLDPGFPTSGLPGEVIAGRPAILAQLSHAQLDYFMRLEAPADLVDDPAPASGGYRTISAFYADIATAIRDHPQQVRDAIARGGPANQVGGNLGYRTIAPRRGADVVDDVLAVLAEVTEQGEGMPGDLTTGPAFQHEQSHFARFAELRYGARYLTPEPAPPLDQARMREFFCGEPIRWPVVVNTLAVPADGYRALLSRDPQAPDVAKELDAFDAAYTAMMIALDDAWNGPVERSWPSLGQAVELMNEMRVLSCFNILRHQVPPPLVAQIAELYPREAALLRSRTRLDEPVFYGPRFANAAA